MTEEQDIRPTCPDCHTALEPQGNIHHDDHRLGVTKGGYAECPECGYSAICTIHVVTQEGVE